MSDQSHDHDRLRREVAYYKRQVAELAGENLKLDYTIPALRHELRQKRDGFALLSQLQQSVAAHTQISSIFEIAVPAINSMLGMDRTLVLARAEREHVYRPAHWTGYREEFTAGFDGVAIELPADFARGEGLLLANRATPATATIDRVREAFDLPYFLAVPVPGEDETIGVIVSGRLKEAAPMFPPLDQGDADTFRAVAGLISATVKNMRVRILEETDRLKTEFFANISHEFRTPITLTLGPIEQILSGAHGQIAPPVAEAIDLMRRNQQRLLGLVNQILDLAKLEAGQMVLRASRAASLNQWVEERVRSFREGGGKPNVEVRFFPDAAVIGSDLWIDLEKLDKLLFNLLSNAYKFTRQGTIDVSTEIVGGNFRLTVADTGIGIKEDQLPYVFDRFRQADASASREFGGTGLGLALVKEVAHLHGGDVVARSQFGRGSTFQLTVPLGNGHLDAASIVEIEDDAASADLARAAASELDREGRTDDVEPLNAEAEAESDPARPTILYAEDNPDLRSYVRTLLRPQYNVFVAADGQDGLQKAHRYAPDLIITDFMMPKVSGREFLQAIRIDPALHRLPVIFLTARAGTGARIESLQAGADDYLSKPFDQGELLARVRNLIRARSQERELEALSAKLQSRVEQQMAELLRTGELRRFLPQPIVASVLSGKLGSNEGFERRKITILRCLLARFDALAETLEPEDLAAVIDEVLREMTAVAVAHGGTVQSIGSGAVAVLFGAPDSLAPDEQARNAVTAAHAMHERVRALLPGWRRFGISEAGVGIGINTGYCTVGVFGSDLLRNYAAVGTPVSIAERLATEAAPGATLIALPAHALAAGELGEATGPKTLPGASGKVEFFEVRAVTEALEPTEIRPAVVSGLGPGTMLSRFRITSKLGAGGMGVVYLAHDTRLGRTVAVKCLGDSGRLSRAALDRFLVEARAASAINHPNVAHIYEIGDERDTPFIVMEYVDGVALDRKIAGQPLELDEAVGIGVQIADALDAAHSRGIIHRDIKPHNVVITQRGDVKVLDFGLAKLTGEFTKVGSAGETRFRTEDGAIVGTVHYMSPEQALGRPLDARSDLFSLGVVLYEMLSGRLPFSAASRSETIDLIVHADPPAIVGLNGAVPPELDSVVRKALVKDAGARYQSAREMVVALRNLPQARAASSN
ncbi:MAG TPA: protein kinase [Thermoanaerobaculia bacterium]|nr:protein kinase [Thermoanaerobaculia bacterium]